MTTTDKLDTLIHEYGKLKFLQGSCSEAGVPFHDQPEIAKAHDAIAELVAAEVISEVLADDKLKAKNRILEQTNADIGERLNRQAEVIRDHVRFLDKLSEAENRYMKAEAQRDALWAIVKRLASQPADDFYKPGDYMAGVCNDAWIEGGRVMGDRT